RSNFSFAICFSADQVLNLKLPTHFRYLAVLRVKRIEPWSPRPGLNGRPRPYQGRALPTELRGLRVYGVITCALWRARRAARCEAPPRARRPTASKSGDNADARPTP